MKKYVFMAAMALILNSPSPVWAAEPTPTPTATTPAKAPNAMSIPALPIPQDADEDPPKQTDKDIEKYMPEQPKPKMCDYDDLIGLSPNAKEVKERFMGYITRVLHVGDVVTMEYLEGRVNMIVDETNKITRITCG